MQDQTKQPAKYLINIITINDINKEIKATPINTGQEFYKSETHSFTSPISTNFEIYSDKNVFTGLQTFTI